CFSPSSSWLLDLPKNQKGYRDRRDITATHLLHHNHLVIIECRCTRKRVSTGNCSSVFALLALRSISVTLCDHSASDDAIQTPIVHRLCAPQTGNREIRHLPSLVAAPQNCIYRRVVVHCPSARKTSHRLCMSKIDGSISVPFARDRSAVQQTWQKQRGASFLNSHQHCFSVTDAPDTDIDFPRATAFTRDR
ncbi:hypothetical protein X777_11083, partial [Ooceraea biroi]